MEGERNNILCNTIAPNAGTSMTATIWPQEMVDAFKPDFVAPLVAYLGSNECETTKSLFEVSGGWIAAVRWERAGGCSFSTAKPVTPEMIQKKWAKITDFDPERASWPTAPSESLGDMVANFGNEEPEDDDGADAAAGGDFVDPEDTPEIKHCLLYTSDAADE